MASLIRHALLLSFVLDSYSAMVYTHLPAKKPFFTAVAPAARFNCHAIFEAIETMSEIIWEDFDKVEIRVGRITAVEPFARARKPSYKLTIDFGEFGTRRSSAQLTQFYTADDLIGRQVLAVTNFPPRNIAGFLSEVLTLGLPAEGVEREGSVVLIQPEREVTPGARLF